MSASSVHRPLSGAVSIARWHYHSSGSRHNNPYQRKETEVGGGKMDKYSLSKNITSEFLTWNWDIIHKAALYSQAAFCVRAKMLGKKDVWALVNSFAQISDSHSWSSRCNTAHFSLQSPALTLDNNWLRTAFLQFFSCSPTQVTINVRLLHSILSSFWMVCCWPVLHNYC